MLTGALRQLFALSEAYPDLKANQNFLALQEELTATEGRVAYAAAVLQRHRADLQHQDPDVPGRDHRRADEASTTREYFEADEGAREVPTVQF